MITRDEHDIEPEVGQHAQRDLEVRPAATLLQVGQGPATQPEPISGLRLPSEDMGSDHPGDQADFLGRHDAYTTRHGLWRGRREQYGGVRTRRARHSNAP